MRPAWGAGLLLGVGLAGALLAFAGRARAGEAAGPSPAAFGIQNPGVPWAQGHEGEALDGACYGISRLTVAYMRLGLDARRPLREATTPGGGNPRATEAQRAADTLFLEQAAALAQNYVLRDRGWSDRVYSQSTNPADVHRTLTESRPTPRNPQVLWLNNGDGAHAVVVDDRQDLRGLGMVVYRVRDPNDPDRPLTLTYHEDRRAFGPFRGSSGEYTTIRHDRSELPEQNRRWLEALAHGLAQPPDRRYLPVWRGERDLPRPPAEYERQLRGGAPRRGPAPPPAPVVEPPEPSSGLSGSVSGSGTEGGVRLYFDPNLVVSEETEEQAAVRWRLLEPLTAQITGGKASFLVQQGGSESVAVVAAGSLDGDTAGGLTRIVGYALDRAAGEVYLLGRREPGRPPIALDTLTVMLRMLWRNGAVPAVSLDPNPDDLYGPQKVRVEGLPADLLHTEPVRVMLEADYAMKRINLGDDPLDIPGFRSEFQLLAGAPRGVGTEYARFWLYPRANAGAEALVTRTAGGEVLRFQSGARLLTETMKRANDMLVGTGQANPIAEEACRLFTSHYARIAELRPVFHELEGVFDAAKLAHVLRLRGVKAASLERLADRRPARVEVPPAYAGIGPRVVRSDGLSTLFVGGGVLSLHQSAAEDIAEAKLVDAAWRPPEGEGAEATLSLPTAVRQAPNRGARIDAGLESLAAAAHLLAGRIPQAREHAQNALSREPAHPVGRLIRGLCRSFVGDDRSALADLDVAVKRAPAARVTRALVRLRLGNTAGALADVRAAAAAAPGDPSVLAQKARIELWALELKSAQADMERLARLDALSPELLSLRSDLRVYRVLPPAARRRYVRVQVSMPLGESLEFYRLTAQLESGDPAATLPALARLQARYAGRKEAPGEIAHLADRVDLLAAEILLRPGRTQNAAQATAALQRVRRRHPTWPTPLLIEADGLPGLTPEQRADRWLRALTLRAADDVIGLELTARHAADVRAYFGFRVLLRVMEAQAESARRRRGPAAAPLNAAAGRVLRGLLPLLKPGPARELVAFLHRHAPLAMRDRPPDAATQARIAKEMVGVVLALKPPPAPGDLDAGGLAALTRFATGMIREPQPGTPAPGVILARVAGALEADWVSDLALRAAAETWVEAAESAGRTLARGSPTAPREPRHPGDGGREAPSDAEIERLLGQWTGVPPFFARLIRHALLAEPNSGEPAGSPRRLASLGAVVEAARTRVTARAAMHLLAQEQQAIVTRGGDPAGVAACERLLGRARFRARG